MIRPRKDQVATRQCIGSSFEKGGNKRCTTHPRHQLDCRQSVLTGTREARILAQGIGGIAKTDPRESLRSSRGLSGYHNAMSEQISGTVERVVFHNTENGFAVLRVDVKGQRGPITVVGKTPRATAGEFVEAAGTWA